MSDQQKTLDFARGEQLALLSQVELPTITTRHGKKVLPRCLLALLRCLDNHGRGRECWLAYETIAAETGYSVSSCKRGIEALQTLSLICVTTRCLPGTKFAVNHYQIVWSELALRRREDRPAGSPPAKREKQSLLPFERVPHWTEQRPRTTEAKPVPSLVACGPEEGEPDRNGVSQGHGGVSWGTERSVLGNGTECPGGHTNRSEAQQEPSGRSGRAEEKISNSELLIAQPESGIDPQPLWSVADRARVMEELENLGYERRESFVREFEPLHSAAFVWELLETFRRNWARQPELFPRGPAAVTYRLRNGAWPTAGVRTIAELDEEQRRKAEGGKRPAGVSAEFAFRQRRDAILKQAEREGWSEAILKQRLVAELPAEWAETPAEAKEALRRIRAEYRV